MGFYAAMYEVHGPAFRYRVVGREFTVLAGPRATQFMNSPEGAACISSKGPWDTFVEVLGLDVSLTALDDEEHTRLRAVMRQGFSAAVLRGRCDEAHGLVHHQVLRLQPGRSFGGLDWVRRLVCEQIGLLIVGRLPGDCFDDFLYFITTVLEVAVLRRMPKLVLMTPAYQRARDRTLEMAREFVKWHRDNPVRADRDLIDALIEEYDRPDGADTSEMDLLIAVVGPYLAGMDTVSNTIGFMLQELHKQPELLAEVRAQVDEVMAEGPLTARSLRKLDLLHRALLETLRLRPVAPALPRTARKDFVFEGYAISEGETLQIATSVAHFDPAFYPDPTRFDIDRFLPDRQEHKAPGAFAPFGAGPHVCLGRFLGAAQIVLTVATMLHSAEFSLDEALHEHQVVLDPLPSPGARLRLTLETHRRHRV